MKIKQSQNSFLLIIFCLTSTLNINAQKLTFNWGKEFINTFIISDIDYLGEDQESYYLLKTDNDASMTWRNIHYTFERYSLNHDLISSTEVYLNSLQKNENAGVFLKIFKQEEKFVILFTEEEKKTKLPIVYSITISKNGTVGAPKAVFKDPKFRAKKHSYLFTPYTVILSANHSKILLIETNTSKVILLSSNLEKLWEKEFVDHHILIPYSLIEKSIAEKFIMCDNNGNVVWLTGFFDWDNTKSVNRYKLQVFRPETNVISEIKLQLDTTKYTSEFNLLQTNNGIYISGFYSNQPKKQNRLAVNGFTYNRININTFEVEQSVSKEFDDPTLSKLFSRISVNLESKDLNAFYEFQPKNVIERENGTLQFVSEGFGSLNYGQSQFFKSLSIIGFQFNKTGEMDWAICIPKDQVAHPWEFKNLSYVLNVQKDKLIFLYNESPKNIEKFNISSKMIDEIMLNNPSKLTLSVATIDNNGKLTLEDYGLKVRLGEMAIIPGFTKTNTGNQIWIATGYKKKRKYGFLKLEL